LVAQRKRLLNKRKNNADPLALSYSVVMLLPMNLIDTMTEEPTTVAIHHRVVIGLSPTTYDTDNQTDIVVDEPLDASKSGVPWLLGSGFFLRRDVATRAEVSGRHLDPTTGEATNRRMSFRYLMEETDIIPIVEIARLDRNRRWAVDAEGNHYPTDISIEALLSLVGDGSSVFAIRRYDGNFAYGVVDKDGNLAAISPWSVVWQEWWLSLDWSSRNSAH